MPEEIKSPEISKELKDAKIKFLKLNKPGPFWFGGSRYDLTVMRADTAKKLIKEKCPYLAYEEGAEPKAATSTAEKETVTEKSVASERTGSNRTGSQATGTAGQ